MEVKNLDFVDNHHQILGLHHADHLQLETEDHNEQMIIIRLIISTKWRW